MISRDKTPLIIFLEYVLTYRRVHLRKELSKLGTVSFDLKLGRCLSRLLVRIMDIRSQSFSFVYYALIDHSILILEVDGVRVAHSQH